MARTQLATPFANFPLGPDWAEFFCDFFTEEDETLFTKTALNSGTGAVTVDEKHGVYRQSGATTTDNSGSQIQLDMEGFSLVAGKETQFFAHGARCSDGTQDEFFCGLAITDTTLCDGTGTLAGGLTHTDSIGLYKPDGESNVYGVVRRDSVQLATGAYAIDATEFNTFAFKVTMDPNTAGKGVVAFYVNGEYIGQINSDTLPYDSEEILTPSLAFNTGNDTGTKTCDWDYVGARQER